MQYTVMQYTTDPSEPLNNVRHERFAQHLALGLTSAAAYAAAGYAGKDKKSRLALKKRPEVAARVAAIKADTELSCALDRGTILSYLTSILTTPAGQLSPDSPLCESCDVTEARRPASGEEPGTTLVQIKKRMPSKLAALRLLTTLCGWEAPRIPPPPYPAL